MDTRVVELLQDPALANEIPVEKIPAVLQAVTVLQGVLVTRLLNSLTKIDPSNSALETDRLLTAQEAASLLGVTPQWLYRRYRSLPFARRLSRKVLRFSELGLRQWLAAHR